LATWFAETSEFMPTSATIGHAVTLTINDFCDTNPGRRDLTM